MKQRWTELEKALQKDPANYRLRRQLLLLNRASISAVHSFCMDNKDLLHLRDLDPSFRVLDQTEADLLRQEVLRNCWRNIMKKKARKPAHELNLNFQQRPGDQAITACARLYDFSQPPFPSDWLEK